MHRRVVVLVALLAAFAMDAALGAPLRTVTEVRARVCCERHCSHTRGVVCKTGCCPTAKSFDQDRLPPATASSTTVPVASLPGVDATTYLVPDPKIGSTTTVGAGTDPPPSFHPSTPLRL